MKLQFNVCISNYVFLLQYFPDRFVKREILNVVVICPFGEFGCNWEGRFEEYPPHVESCDFALLTCEYCGENLHKNQLIAHSQTCPKSPNECSLSVMISTISRDKSPVTAVHVRRRTQKRVRSFEDLPDQAEVRENCGGKKLIKKDFVETGETMPCGQCYDSGIDNSVPPQPQKRKVSSSASEDRQLVSKYDDLKGCRSSQQTADAENCKYSLPYYRSVPGKRPLPCKRPGACFGCTNGERPG